MIGPALFIVFDTLQDEKLNFNQVVEQNSACIYYVFYFKKKQLDGR